MNPAHGFIVVCGAISGWPHHGIYLVEWDGTKWTRASRWVEPINDKVLPLIDSAANSYVSANTGWPKRTEACDKSS